MTPLEALQQHRALCDELHQLALEENRFLQQHRAAPGADLLERKRALLTRLDQTLTALRESPRGGAGTEFRDAIEQTRSRILQILQLDKENEQLLLRYSLAAARPASATTAPSASLLHRIYQQHS
jgi:hypothetical protein